MHKARHQWPYRRGWSGGSVSKTAHTWAWAEWKLRRRGRELARGVKAWEAINPLGTSRRRARDAVDLVFGLSISRHHRGDRACHKQGATEDSAAVFGRRWNTPSSSRQRKGILVTRCCPHAPSSFAGPIIHVAHKAKNTDHPVEASRDAVRGSKCNFYLVSCPRRNAPLRPFYPLTWSAIL